jgi:hypothetical protein
MRPIFLDVKGVPMFEGEEFRDQSCDEDPLYLLTLYPGLHQLLIMKVMKDRDVGVWRELKTLIQYNGWTCEVSFNWHYSKGAFSIEDVKFKAINKAPLSEEQYEGVY